MMKRNEIWTGERQEETRQTTLGSSREPIYLFFYFLGLREARSEKKEHKPVGRDVSLKELRNGLRKEKENYFKLNFYFDCTNTRSFNPMHKRCSFSGGVHRGNCRKFYTGCDKLARVCYATHLRKFRRSVENFLQVEHKNWIFFSFTAIKNSLKYFFLFFNEHNRDFFLQTFFLLRFSWYFFYYYYFIHRLESLFAPTQDGCWLNNFLLFLFCVTNTPNFGSVSDFFLRTFL